MTYLRSNAARITIIRQTGAGIEIREEFVADFSLSCALFHEASKLLRRERNEAEGGQPGAEVWLPAAPLPGGSAMPAPQSLVGNVMAVMHSFKTDAFDRAIRTANGGREIGPCRGDP